MTGGNHKGMFVTGGGWVTAKGCGRLSEGRFVEVASGPPALAKASDVFDEPLARYGRFDTYTKMGAAAVALALRDSALHVASEKRNIGIVSSSLSESLETDIEYYRTTLDAGGALASPNLFSYTLPGIVLGECAVHFKLAGPTFCVGEGSKPGMEAMANAMGLLDAGKTEAMLAGLLQSPAPHVQRDLPCVAAFVVLETRARPEATHCMPLIRRDGKLTFEDGAEVTSILDVFNR